MKILSTLLICLFFCFSAIASGDKVEKLAKFEVLALQDIQNEVFQLLDYEVETLKPTLKELYKLHIFFDTGVYRTFLSKKQSELEMITQFVHSLSGYMTTSKMVKVEKLKSLSEDLVYSAIVDKFYHDKMSDDLHSKVCKTTITLLENVESFTRPKDLVNYKYTVRGRVYGDFGYYGFILFDSFTNELVVVGNGWSD